ncbi:c-type cytochrome biogenesis protein CcmI [Rhizobium leguminosarum]|uniref:c-type cytochrome biogenesis protein CcmI n=1 Tax=Rhizobium leguminosarum TaxID=384 RepID=UPI0010323577|nr:c-type cytochrome biogenesis protein CcmI [Rhizobium leguminosarum]TAU73084.1 c-type cytochrome biogenesis protein CcmI [Rhizobium leguminosarum]TAX01529.1 c-type cytochrome biogenesis protein CcmI [Rhizobium leguminosarum]TAX02904.1 c-type cytochrome biogenesis protein CcmI [Rhizobium leguminosarum]TAY11515.1 c-type cytochrome biogenesis protein CcmI [Rhizobium leguminosarum]
MVIWIVFAVITAAIIASLLHPLASGRVRVNGGEADAARVYRDQLLELDRELQANEIGRNEYEYARAETARRLFKASEPKREERQRLPHPRHPRRWLRLAVVAFLPLASIGLYVLVGSPDMPSRPLQARLEEPGQDIAILVAKTERHLASQPDDGRGWDVIAPIYLRTSRVVDARSAYRNALRLLGPNVHRLGGLAEALMAEAHGSVTEEARQVLEQSLTLEPDNPRARFYIALSMEQAGRPNEARQAFEALAKQSPADAPWLPLVNEHIAMNGGAKAGANPAAPGANPAAPGANPAAPGANLAAPGNPTQQDVAAAETMSAGDRQQMIRGMVESLDAKLSEDPNNFEGWMRLVRSYAVLNDKDRAAGALKRGLAAFPPPGEQGRQLLALARELGIATEEATQ